MVVQHFYANQLETLNIIKKIATEHGLKTQFRRKKIRINSRDFEIIMEVTGFESDMDDRLDMFNNVPCFKWVESDAAAACE